MGRATKHSHVAALAERAEYLRERIATQDGSPGSLNLAARELAGLDWAVPILADLVGRIAERGRDVHWQRRDASLRVTCREAMVALSKCDPDTYDRLMGRAHEVVIQEVHHALYKTQVPEAAP